jgi:hypothetical protein
MTTTLIAPMIQNTIEFAGLRSSIQGEVCLPGDTNYDEWRQGYNLHVDQYPAAIVAVASTTDVVAAVNFARQQQLPIALKATGHGVVKACDGGLLIATDRMREVQIDPAARTARVEAGVVWGDVLPEAQNLGLAPLLGSSSTVGAIGYSLGGGIGWLTRKYGLAVDSVRSFEIVTGDGQLRQVSATQNSDLFWGVRGATSNLGIVTAMEIDLYPVETVYAGNLYYPIELAPQVMAAYRQWIETLPEEFTTGILLMHIPPLPVFPPALQGKSAVVIRGCYTGSATEAETLLQPMRKLGTPLLDAFGEMSFRDAATISNDPPDPFNHFTRTEVLHALSAETIATLIQVAGTAATSPFFAVEVRHLGGAMTRIPHDANAFSHRDMEFILFMYGVLHTPEQEASVNQYLAEVKTLLAPHITGKIYHNFLLDTDYTAERGRATRSTQHYDRLAVLKSQYDPSNLFRFNANVLPAQMSCSLPGH